MKNFRLILGLIFTLNLFLPGARAEYHGFNTGGNSDGIVQDVRWPYWAESTYNAIYSQTLNGSDGASCYFYGGMPSDTGGNVSIIWSFWPPGGSAAGKAVTAYWTGPNMYAPPHVGEGASGKASGAWPLIVSNQWYREVLRVWQPPHGPDHQSYAARWLRDPATSNWYHIATMSIPFDATGISGLSGFQEDFGHGNRNPRRTDYRNVYYHAFGGGAWQMANKFTPSVRQINESGACGLIDNATAAFFETCSSSNYLYDVAANPPPTTGNLVMLASTNTSASLVANPPPNTTVVAQQNNYAQYTFTIANQPAAPAIDPIVVSSSSATVYGSQLVTAWSLPATSSPQFAYQIDVFNNAGYTGSPTVSFYDIDPEARQKLLDITGVATPHVRLTIIDVFNVTNAPILLTPANATLSAATSAPGAVRGLNYKYYESATNFPALPNFNTLTPVYQGAVDYLDLTVRRQRSHYAFNYTGYINVPSNGIYTFTLTSSDGSQLIIDGTTVVDWDGQHSPAPKSGWIALAAGLHTVNAPYFFNTQQLGGELIDQLGLAWSGPGIAPDTTVPDSAWFRAPAGGEPVVALTSPADGATVSGSNVLFGASVAANGNTLNKVQFYIGNTYWDQDTTAPYQLNDFVWAAPNNPIRVRLFYNSGYTLDSAPPNLVTTTNMTLAPWLLASMSEHVYPNGARIANGTYNLIGDGLNLLGRQVTGDCTLVAHRSGMIANAAGPDGQWPDSSCSAGIMLRGTTNSTPGTPLGNGANRYACVYSSVGGGTYYQNDTMANAGGPYSSGNLGSYAWYKVERVGDTFTTSVSADGVNWTQESTVTLSGIGSTIYVGVFTFSQYSQNPNVNWASFDNVSILGSLVGPPTVSVSPSPATAFTGQAETLTAQPGGNPPFFYQWQVDGAAISGATNATLTLNNLQPTNSGLYGVTVSNANGTASASSALSVLAPAPAPAQILASGPLAYYRLNETAGPTAHDSAGNFDATGEGNVIFGAPGVTNAPFTGFEPGNLAAQFDGSSSDIAAPPFNVTTKNFTITGWVKVNGAQNSWSGLVFSRGSGHGVGLMEVNNAGKVELRYSWNDNGTDYNHGTGLFLPTNNVWTFIALTIEPTRAIVYMATNSTLQSNILNVANIGQTFSGSFYLGLDPNSGSRRLNGALDEVAFYNRTLSGAQLGQILSASVAPPLPAVSLTSPANGAAFVAPAALDLSASVTTNGHSITGVSFYNGANLIGAAAGAPYDFAWNNVPAGSYTLLAQVSYDGGAASSAPAFVTVVNPPATPATITPVALAGNLIQITWPAVTNPTAYELSRDGTVIATQGGTSYLDFGLTPNTTYAYSVVATSAFGSSGPSVTNSATTFSSGAARWWDADSGSGPQDGSDVWNPAGMTWWTGAATVAWADGSLAIFGNGTATNCTVSLANNATPAGIIFNANGGGTYEIAGSGGSLNLSGAPTFSGDYDALISAPMIGSGSLTKNGAGTLTLNTQKAYTGATVVNGGALNLTGGGVAAGTLTGTPAITVNNGGTLLLSSQDALGWTGGKEALVVNSGGTVSANGAARSTLANTVTLNGGTLTATGPGDGNGNFSLFNGAGVTATSDAAGHPAVVGAGKISLQYNGSVPFNVARGPAAPAADLIVSSALPNFSGYNAGLTKTGSGVMAINGQATYSLATALNGGALLVNGALGAGAVTVANTATLGGTGSIGGATTVSGGGTLTPGNAGIGALNFAGSLTLNAGSKTVMELDRTGSTLTNDAAIVTGTLTLGGTLTVTNLGPAALAAGDSFDLFNAGTLTGSFSGLSLPALNAGLAWDTTQLSSSGVITVAVATYTLAYLAGPNGGLSGVTSQTVSYGGSGSAVTATPNGGYAFTGWSDGSLANPRTDVNVTNNLTVTANFVSQLPPVITSLSQPDGSGAFTLSGTGTANAAYVLLVATNLPAAWTPILTNHADAGGQFQFTNLDTTGYNQRFYRIKAQ